MSIHNELIDLENYPFIFNRVQNINMSDMLVTLDQIDSDMNIINFVKLTTNDVRRIKNIYNVNIDNFRKAYSIHRVIFMNIKVGTGIYEFSNTNISSLFNHIYENNTNNVFTNLDDDELKKLLTLFGISDLKYDQINILNINPNAVYNNVRTDNFVIISNNNFIRTNDNRILENMGTISFVNSKIKNLYVEKFNGTIVFDRCKISTLIYTKFYSNYIVKNITNGEIRDKQSTILKSLVNRNKITIDSIPRYFLRMTNKIILGKEFDITCDSIDISNIDARLIKQPKNELISRENSGISCYGNISVKNINVIGTLFYIDTKIIDYEKVQSINVNSGAKKNYINSIDLSFMDKINKVKFIIPDNNITTITKNNENLSYKDVINMYDLKRLNLSKNMMIDSYLSNKNIFNHKSVNITEKYLDTSLIIKKGEYESIIIDNNRLKTINLQNIKIDVLSINADNPIRTFSLNNCEIGRIRLFSKMDNFNYIFLMVDKFKCKYCFIKDIGNFEIDRNINEIKLCQRNIFGIINYAVNSNNIISIIKYGNIKKLHLTNFSIENVDELDISGIENCLLVSVIGNIIIMNDETRSRMVNCIFTDVK